MQKLNIFDFWDVFVLLLWRWQTDLSVGVAELLAGELSGTAELFLNTQDLIVFAQSL